MAKGDYDSALHYLNISLKEFEGSEDAPYTLNNIGSVYMLQKQFDKAKKKKKKAIQLAEKLDAKKNSDTKMSEFFIFADHKLCL